MGRRTGLRGSIGAEQGRLVTFCGGDSRHRSCSAGSCRLFQRHSRIGALGSGQTLKLCNQLIVACNLVAIAEALALANAFDMDLESLPAALAGICRLPTTADLWCPNGTAADQACAREMSLMRKDIDTVMELATSAHYEFPLAGAARNIYRHACERGLSHETWPRFSRCTCREERRRETSDSPLPNHPGDPRVYQATLSCLMDGTIMLFEYASVLERAKVVSRAHGP